MLSFQQKITRHTEKQKNMAHSKENNSIDPLKDLIADLLDKDFKNNCLEDSQSTCIHGKSQENYV